MGSLSQPTRGRWLWLAVLLLAICVLGVQAVGVGLDMAAAIRDPYGLDYGEGIVWQQAALIPGPLMYGTGQGLPFIVFHYPPVYYLLTRAVGSFMPDLLSAGRLVSSLATFAITPLVAGLVVIASPRTMPGRSVDYLLIAVFAGLLATTLHVVRTWGMLMRVDMLSVALGLAGVLASAVANGRLRGTIMGLLLCLAAVYCKQTQLPAGIAVFLVALIRRPAIAAAAGGITLAIGLAALGLMQWLTMGGFLQNIIGYNINRFSLNNAWNVFGPELASLPVMLVAVVAAGSVAWHLRPMASLRQKLTDRAMAARATILLHYVLASFMLLTAFKSGGSSNYLIDWLCIGCVLIGIWLAQGAAATRNSPVMVMLSLVTLYLPFRHLPDRLPQVELDRQAALVDRIARSAKPVGSADMVLLMRAGKPVVYEPAIVTELSAVGRWNETPLVQMIDARGFAFLITSDNGPGPTDRRSPAVDAAMRRTLPRVEPAGKGFWLHLPE